MGTPDIAEKLLAAIGAKEAKARAADTKTYNDEGNHVSDPSSLKWRADRDHDGQLCVRDHSREMVALASDVDLIDETWEQITPGRIEFIADNDPESVLRRCAADREIVQRYLRVIEELETSRYTLTVKIRLTVYENVMYILARGYGVTP